jgi:glycosyltransferase involved in cell wall biosynthesis
MRNIEEVTVAICVRNGERYISEAIESALEQSHRPKQILIIDDGSTDSTVRIAESLQCDVYSQGQLGLGTARNKAFELASGEYVFLLDSDDIMVKQAIESLLLAVIKDSDCVGSVGYRKNFISPELEGHIEVVNKSFLERELGSLPSGSLWKKSIGISQKFDESIRVTDVDWMTRLHESGLNHARTDDLVMMRRIHQNNESTKPETRREYLLLARRRLLGRK